MKVAIAGMENIGHGQAVLLAEPFNRRKHRRKAAAGNDTVLHVIGRRDFSHR